MSIDHDHNFGGFRFSMGTMRIEDDHPLHAHGTATRALLNVIRSRADLGLHKVLEGTTTIGREPECTFALRDWRVSRRHAMISFGGEGTWTLRDLQSTNGTLLNGSRVDGAKTLSSGDKIGVGDTVLQFSLVDELEIGFHSEVAAAVSTDPLTGLRSRRSFDEALEFSLQHARHTGDPLGLLMLDMDGVKQINDTHGHLFGAHVIGETGRLIARVLGSSGNACRFGGDEFSAFLPGSGPDEAREIAERIRVAVETAGMSKNGVALRPTVSIGVACYPGSGHELTALVTSADAALYRAKARGKNQVAF